LILYFLAMIRAARMTRWLHRRCDLFFDCCIVINLKCEINEFICNRLTDDDNKMIPAKQGQKD